MNIPNILTLLRILLIPFMVFVYYLPFYWNHWFAGVIFVFACLTDWLDGLLARVLKQTSAFGAFLDPVADKLIVSVALVLLVSQHDLPYLSIPAAIIVSREIMVSALREWMAEMGKRASIAVSLVGKLKTLLQMAAITFLLSYKSGLLEWPRPVGYILIYLAAILTVWSMTMYLKTAWPDLVSTKTS